MSTTVNQTTYVQLHGNYGGRVVTAGTRCSAHSGVARSGVTQKVAPTKRGCLMRQHVLQRTRPISPATSGRLGFRVAAYSAHSLAVSLFSIASQASPIDTDQWAA